MTSSHAEHSEAKNRMALSKSEYDLVTQEESASIQSENPEGGIAKERKTSDISVELCSSHREADAVSRVASPGEHDPSTRTPETTGSEDGVVLVIDDDTLRNVELGGRSRSEKESERRISVDGNRRASGSDVRSCSRTSKSSEVQLELARLQNKKDQEKVDARRRREEQVARLREKMDEERRKKGAHVFPASGDCLKMVQEYLSEEHSTAMEARQKQLVAETEDFKAQIEDKYRFNSQKEPSSGLVSLVATFYRGNELVNERLPTHITRSLTSEEIKDLKLVFDMFDVKGRGYIISYDLKKAASMLGFRASKHVFKEMIDELANDQKGKVTFTNFLDFMIKSQGDGRDPYEDIMTGFRMLDVDNKGFLTYSDLRSAADKSGSNMSNRALREMFHEADVTGNGKISATEFIRVMLETNTFRQTKSKSRLK